MIDPAVSACHVGDCREQRLVRMAANANGRELAYDKRRHGWVVAA